MGESSSHSDWEHIDRRHRALIALGVGVLVVALTVAGIMLAARTQPDATPRTDAVPVITPAEQTEEPTAVIPSYALTPTPDSSAPVVPGGSGPGGAAANPGANAGRPVALIAYRRDGALCVAGEDGSGERQVIPSAGGVFSFSPDGSTIAMVDEDGVLWLHAVAGGQPVRIGAAEPEPPSWAPDSSWLVYTAPGPRVTRVARTGTSAQALMPGRMPAIAADGTSVVAVSPATQEPAVLVWRGADVARHAVSVPVTAVASDGRCVFLGTAPADSSGATLRSITMEGEDERVLVRGPRDASLVSLSVSPDATWLAYARHGDDGRSELHVLSLDDLESAQVSGRRDSYPLQWGATPGSLYLIEGNRLQGETSSLVSVTLPGGTRRLIVPDASL